MGPTASLILIYAFFFVGYLLHMLLQVRAQVAAKNNGATSMLQVLKDSVFKLLARLGFSLVLFWYIRLHPEMLTKLLNLVGISLSGSLGELFTLPLNAPLSWVFGYEVDSLLAFIPVLKNIVPQLDFQDHREPPKP
jgi:hypothetical protein